MSDIEWKSSEWKVVKQGSLIDFHGYDQKNGWQKGIGLILEKGQTGFIRWIKVFNLTSCCSIEMFFDNIMSIKEMK